jgi:hypothetical protein
MLKLILPLILEIENFFKTNVNTVALKLTFFSQFTEKSAYYSGVAFGNKAVPSLDAYLHRIPLRHD